MRFHLVLLILVLSCALFACQQSIVDEYQILNTSFCPRDNCADSLINFIDSANSFLYCAIYNLDDSDVVNSLLKKSKEIDVLVIVDESSKLNLFEKYESSGLMHHKFCIKDGDIVFTGSYNPTIRGGYFNNNNILVIKSKFLYLKYLNEFYTMLGIQTEPNPYVSNMSVYFSLVDDTHQIILNELNGAKNRIWIAAYSFTDPDIADILIKKQIEGVNVSVIFEKSQNGRYSQFDRLYSRGIAQLDNNTYTMHHKFFIVDDKVITGSYNPTRNAYRSNRENFLIFEDDFVIKQFEDEFKFLKSRSQDINFTLVNSGNKLILFVDDTFIEISSDAAWFNLGSNKFRYELKKGKLNIYDFHNNIIRVLESNYDVQ